MKPLFFGLASPYEFVAEWEVIMLSDLQQTKDIHNAKHHVRVTDGGQHQLKANGIDFVSEAEESSSGPGSFIIIDPDGNPIMIDQHV